MSNENEIISDVRKPGYRRVVVKTPHGVAEFAAMDSEPLRFDVFAVFTDRDGMQFNMDDMQGRSLDRSQVKERWETFKKFYNIEEVK
jgi:hypothetical protein